MEEKTISLERFYYAAARNGILSCWLLLVEDALEPEDRRRDRVRRIVRREGAKHDSLKKEMLPAKTKGSAFAFPLVF